MRDGAQSFPAKQRLKKAPIPYIVADLSIGIRFEFSMKSAIHTLCTISRQSRSNPLSLWERVGVRGKAPCKSVSLPLNLSFSHREKGRCRAISQKTRHFSQAIEVEQNLNRTPGLTWPSAHASRVLSVSLDGRIECGHEQSAVASARLRQGAHKPWA
jgi:hypothetical protein